MHGGQKVAKPQFSSQTQAGQCAPIKYLLLIDHQSHVKKKKKFALCSPSFAEAPFSNSSDVSNLFANLNRPSFSALVFFSVKSSSHFCDSLIYNKVNNCLLDLLASEVLNHILTCYNSNTYS